MLGQDEIAIEFGTLKFEQTGRPREIELLLGIQANLRIVIDGREWFSEPMFPVVELAAAVNAWLRQGGDLMFDSMEAEESPFLWVRETNDGCLIGAAWQSFAVERPLPCASLRDAFSRFVSGVVVASKRNLGLDVSDVARR